MSTGTDACSHPNLFIVNRRIIYHRILRIFHIFLSVLVRHGILDSLFVFHRCDGLIVFHCSLIPPFGFIASDFHHSIVRETVSLFGTVAEVPKESRY
ncbi:MAG: hypothetical protein ACFNZJ_02015 [Parascardovia denticolens]|uniref:hypothetical protein n=1 Tax=Parascardovia denticolens TaxID=78258 RepID=UPI001187607B|nr:hypothetical protein [Parascardovia denticolens]